MKRFSFLQVVFVLVAAMLAGTSSVAAQGLLYDNGPLITHPNQGCGGDHASQITGGLNLFGVNQNFNGPFRIADDFTVTAFGGWQIDSIQFFGYQTGNTSTTSTFTSIRIEIYDGPPDDPNSTLVYGDINTNVMISTYYSTINRVSTNLADCQRRIMVNTASVGTTLPAGTYWLVWAATGTLASGPWQPPVTIPGQLITGNAKQFASGAWQDILDNGNPQGVPFKIYGTANNNAVKDIYVQSVTFTPANPQVGSPITVSALIRDLGTEPNPPSVPITYKVNSIPAAQGDGVGQTFAPSWAGDSAIVTFTTTYTPTVFGNFTIYVRSFYPGDQVPANDVASRTAYAQPAVDLTVQSFIQTSGLPTPEPPGRPGSSPPALRVGESEGLPAVVEMADVDRVDADATGSVGGDPIFSPEALIGVRSIVRNDGFSSSTYTLHWDVEGASQPPYSGPSVAANGGRDTANFTYDATTLGTLLTTGRVAAAGDPNAANDTLRFRMRVYPSSYVRTIYDRGDNVVNTRIGFGSPTAPIIAAVRYNAAVTQRLRGLDVICQTDSGAGPMTIKVRGEGPNTSTPGPVLFQTTVTGPAGSAYFPRTLDYITIPFDSATAPIVSAGQTFWITIAYPTNAPFPGGAHSSGFTPGRSFYSSDDVTFSLLQIGTTEYAWIMRAYGDTNVPPMVYSSSTTTQNTIRVAPNTTNQHIIGIQVVTSGYAPPINVTQFTLNTTGTTNTADIANAKIWYTGTSGVFAATMQFGSTVPSPSGSYSITGSQTLLPGTNYFWLTYDIVAGATLGNLVDAECTSITVAGTPQTPTVTAPAGARQISSPLSGTYTIGLGPFNRILGRSLYHQTFTRRVMREVPVRESASKGITDATALHVVRHDETRFVEGEEEYSVVMENGRPYSGKSYLPLSGGDVVGDFTTITEAVNTLNSLGVSGPVQLLLIDNSYPSETFPITINITNPGGLPSATNTVTIKPSTGVTPVISGSSSGGPIIRILNTNYITIDGSNTVGGTTRDLTISNTSTTSPNVIHIGSLGTTPIGNVTVKNCNLINGAQTSSAVVVSDGNTVGSPGYFSNITIQNNSIQKAYIGVYANGGTSPQQGSNLSYIGNSLDASGANAIRYIGLYMQGVNGATVRGNSIGNFDGANGEDDRGIWTAAGTINAVVEKNQVYGLQYTGTAGWGAQGIVVSTTQATSNILVKNNMIHTLSGDGWDYTAILADNPIGIYAFGTQGGVKIYNNSIHLYGNTLNQASALSIGIALGTGTTADIRNNVIVNNLGLLGTTGYGSAGVFAQTANTQFSAINYNNYYVNPTGTGVKAIGQIATTASTTLAAWQTASGGEANGVEGDPLFVSNTDLHITNTSSPASNAGTPLADVTDDFDGNARHPSTPDIGADEFGVSTVTINVPVAVNWNIVSLPVSDPTSGDSVRQVYVNSSFAYGFAFVPGSGYQQRYIMQNGPGYWVKSTATYTQDITGTPLASLSIPVSAGWNMIGSRSTATDTGCVVWSGGASRVSSFFAYNGGYVIVSSLPPGKGFWIKSGAAGTITLQDCPLGKPQAAPAGRSIEELNSITIRDANGGMQTLYFGVNDEIQVSMYELPPVPPQGAFDARFTSADGGTMVQTHAAEVSEAIEWPIAIQSSAYPLTVTWKVNGADAVYELRAGEDVVQTLTGEGTLRIGSEGLNRLTLRVVGGSALPKEYALWQNYPNPFNPTTNIKFALPVESKVSAEVYNILGQRVATLVNEVLPAGYHTMEWNGTGSAGQPVGSGVYFLRLHAKGANGKDFTDVKKLLLVK